MWKLRLPTFSGVNFISSMFSILCLRPSLAPAPLFKKKKINSNKPGNPSERSWHHSWFYPNIWFTNLHGRRTHCLKSNYFPQFMETVPLKCFHVRGRLWLQRNHWLLIFPLDLEKAFYNHCFILSMQPRNPNTLWSKWGNSGGAAGLQFWGNWI